MSKKILDNKLVYYWLLALVMVLTIIGAIFLKHYIGFAYLAQPASTITTIQISDVRVAYRWHGIFGLAFSESGFNETQSASLTPGAVSTQILVFECLDPNQNNQEMYASLNNSIDFSNIRPGTTAMIDQGLLNFSNDTFSFDTAAAAFTHNISFLLGAANISNVPAAYTYVNDGPDAGLAFYTGILNASGQLAFVIKLAIPSQSSFKGTNVRYQSILPVNNLSRTYYFFADPNDQCPPNFGIVVQGAAILAGYVFESNSTTPLVNAIVSAGGNSTTTDALGFYNFSVIGGYQYDLVSIKSGYLTNITRINATIGNTTNQNMTMARFFGYNPLNGTLIGYTRDNSTGTILSSVLISVDGFVFYSDEDGNYSKAIPAGSHVITATYPGYLNFIGNFTLGFQQNLSYIINMTQIITGATTQNGTPFLNGTLEGYIRDNATSLFLGGVEVVVSGTRNISNASGFYSLTTYEGLSNLIATKALYEAFYSEVNISAGNVSQFNFSLQPIEVIPGEANGTVFGVVSDTSNDLLQGVFVSSAGISNRTNITGSYLLEDVVPGTHYLIATAAGYENYFALINVTAGGLLEHDITLTTLDQVGLGPGQGPGLGPGDGPGLGAGQGPGRGPGTAIQPQVEEPREIPDFKVSVKDIIKKIEEGNFLNVPITINNYLEEAIAVSFSIEGSVKPLIRLSTEAMAIDSQSVGELELTILGNTEPGVYDGFLVLQGDIEERIPLYVLVKAKDRLDVESIVIKITPNSRMGVMGKDFKYRLDVQNLLLDEQYPVNLSYRLEGINNNVSIPLGKEKFDILTSFTILKSFKIPRKIPQGDYRLVIEAKYNGITSEYATIFEIRVPFYQYKLFGFLPIWILLLLALLAMLGTYIGWLIKKKGDDKKRYHIDLDYNQLPKPGPRSAFVGLIAETTKRTYFDLDVMQTHTLVAGSTGGGKTVAAQSIIEEALLHGASVLVFDPTVQWTGFLSRCQDKKFLELYPRFGLKKTDARAFNGNIHQVNDAREVIEFRKFIKPGEINVFVVNKLETRDYETFVSNVIRQVFKENMPESKQLKLVLVFDEFHRLLPKYGGTGQVLIQVERAAREFRKWGVGLVLISQVISDFQSEVLANINTQIQMRTKDEGDLTRTKNEYGERYLQSLVKAAVGAGMVENSNYNRGKPYFVQFRPLLHSTVRISDVDLENYNKYNKIIDDLDYQLDQLEKEALDVFDLRLELKLALDKVKAGSFNMVDIYLEGLTPRLATMWKKIGKQPQKKAAQFVSESELTKELEKAKELQEKETQSRAGNQSALAKAKAAKDLAKPAQQVTSSQGPIDKQPNDKKPTEEKPSTQRIDPTKKSDDKSEEKEGGREENKEETKQVQNDQNDNTGQDALEEVLKKVNETSEKNVLVSLYKDLQQWYGKASREDKIRILNSCKLIKSRLG